MEHFCTPYFISCSYRGPSTPNILGGQANILGGQANILGGQANILGGQANILGGQVPRFPHQMQNRDPRFNFFCFIIYIISYKNLFIKFYLL